MGLYDYTVYEMIKVNAESYGKKPAWFEADTGREATFLQIKEEVDRLAAGLKGKGITKGDRIAVLGKNSLEYFLIYGAAAALGAIVLPVNWRLSEEEIVYILNDCQPKIIFADSDYHTFMENSEKKTAFIELFFSLDSDAKNYPGIATLLENDAQIEPEEISAHDDFIIIHTAATAGRPRGALLSHGNMLTASLHLCYGLAMR
jgi:long-chain acyl-CoA synthetase